jgi:hypothetical protein
MSINTEKIKGKVEHCLRNFPETRDSDITLTIKLWAVFYGDMLRKDEEGSISVKLKYLFELPREDNIKRVRAQFNSEGKYFPTNWKVAKARGIKEDEWRLSLGYPAKQETIFPTKTESYMDPQRSVQQPQESKLF